LTIYICGSGYIFVDATFMSTLLQIRTRACALNVPNTRQCVLTGDVHGTRATNAFATRSTKRQCRILLVLDFYKRVKHHRAAFVHVNFICLCTRLVASHLRVPTVDLYIHVPACDSAQADIPQTF
jgi:hypothetical protein